jgi:hypothetical protein
VGRKTHRNRSFVRIVGSAETGDRAFHHSQMPVRRRGYWRRCCWSCCWRSIWRAH